MTTAVKFIQGPRGRKQNNCCRVVPFAHILIIVVLELAAVILALLLLFLL